MSLFAKSRPARVWTTLALFILLLTGCAQPAAGLGVSPTPADTARPLHTPSKTAGAAAATLTPTVTTEPSASPALTDLNLWVDPALPRAFIQGLQVPANIHRTTNPARADLRLETAPGASAAKVKIFWVYALVAPFPTLEDNISYKDLQALWLGKPPRALADLTLLVSPETRAVLESRWSASDSPQVQTANADALLQAAWQAENTWAIVPFESIEPRWKVLQVGRVSPLDKSFDEEMDRYPLAIPITVGNAGADDEAAAHAISAEGWVLPTNRHADRLTTLAMTGVTALARNIAAKMESEGVTYPARDIGEWLRDADLTHISNEVSFKEDCPKPRPDMRFCSRPEYIGLLEEVGTDIVELTGNHNLDWGPEPYLATLQMYEKRGWLTYGGGLNLEAAQQRLLVEHNGNRLAFLGCSPAGPEPVWATENEPGSAPCDLDWMEATLQDLRGQGYLPVVTFQHTETDWYVPTLAQRMPDFRRMAQAGAVVVQGSQAHFPQTMTFVEDSFVHYGLGNLFFDQMEPKDIRQAFIDQHVFYEGRYLGVQLRTTMLEDSARPRPMTADERLAFLEKVFELSQWGEK